MRRICAIVVFLLLFLGWPTPGSAAERECEFWLKLVDGEIRERREALEKAPEAQKGAMRQELAQAVQRTQEAREQCKAGKDRDATLAAMDMWNAFVEVERQANALSLASRLNVLTLRIDRLRTAMKRGWSAKALKDDERRFLEALDTFDRKLAEVLRQTIR